MALIGTGDSELDSARLMELLASEPQRLALVNHPFFDLIERGNIDEADVRKCISQWWHPLAYFPTFLSRTISSVPWLSAKSTLSKILYQELGEGSVEQSHERLFVVSMVGIGMTEEEVTEAEPYPETAALVEGMEASSHHASLGLGYVYGIEVVDLPMVQWVGTAIERTTGHTGLPWVNVHLVQESDHVANVRTATSLEFSDEQAADIVRGAKEMWALWHGFFDGLQVRLEPVSLAA